MSSRPGWSRPRATRAGGRMVCATDGKAPMRSRPARLARVAASAADASSRTAKTDPAWRARTTPAGVSATRRPERSSSGTPASRSSAASCCDTADGVYASASATAVIVPRWESSNSRRSRRTSIIRPAYKSVKKPELDLHSATGQARGMDTSLRGLHVPLITPFTTDGDLDPGALERLARAAVEAGAAGLVALGTTGEPAALTTAERHTVLDVCARVCREYGTALIVGAGSNDTAGTVRALRDLAAWPEV